MSRPLVKICGMTRMQDVELCAALGADLLESLEIAVGPRLRVDHGVGRAVHLAEQLGVDRLLIPLLVLVVLDPLVVAHRDASGVGKDVWNDENIILLKNFIRLWSCRIVRSFND